MVDRQDIADIVDRMDIVEGEDIVNMVEAAVEVVEDMQGKAGIQDNWDRYDMMEDMVYDNKGDDGVKDGQVMVQNNNYYNILHSYFYYTYQAYKFSYNNPYLTCRLHYIYTTCLYLVVILFTIGSHDVLLALLFTKEQLFTGRKIVYMIII